MQQDTSTFWNSSTYGTTHALVESDPISFQNRQKYCVELLVNTIARLGAHECDFVICALCGVTLEQLDVCDDALLDCDAITNLCVVLEALDKAIR
jgi:hypothetical protein